ncbi:hypothetical protein HDU78_009867 [Chytriomyces hyalinus]|nr:hypothetical protein HDU78_009867 [Chytriomyces hyalinus]
MRVTRGKARGKSSTKTKLLAGDSKEDEVEVISAVHLKQDTDSMAKPASTKSSIGTRASSQKRVKAAEEDKAGSKPEAENSTDAQNEGDLQRDAVCMSAVSSALFLISSLQVVKRLVGAFEECTKETTETCVSPLRSSSRRKDTSTSKTGLHRVLASQIDAHAPMTPGRRALGATKGRVKAMSSVIENAIHVSDKAAAKPNAATAIDHPAVDSPSLSHAVRAKRVSGAPSLLVKKLAALAPAAESKATRVKDAVCALEGHFRIDSTGTTKSSNLVQKEVEQAASPKAKLGSAKKRVQPRVAAAIAAVRGQGPPLHDYEVFDNPEPILPKTAAVDTPVTAAADESTVAKSSKGPLTKRRATIAKTNPSAVVNIAQVSWDLVDSPAIASTSSITPSFDTPSREGPAIKSATRIRPNSSTNASSVTLELEPSASSPKKRSAVAATTTTKNLAVEKKEEATNKDHEITHEKFEETAPIPPITPQNNNSSSATTFCLPMESPIDLPPPTSAAKLPATFNFNFVNANPATRSLIPPAQLAPSAPSFASPLRKSFVPVHVDDDVSSVISSTASTPASIGPPQVPTLFSNSTNIQKSPSKRVVSQGNPLLVVAAHDHAAENRFAKSQEHAHPKKGVHDLPEPQAQSQSQQHIETLTRPGRTHVARLTLEPATAATPNTKKRTVSVPAASNAAVTAASSNSFDVAKIGREFTVDMMVPANPNIRFTTAAQTPPAAERVTGKRSRGGSSGAGPTADNAYEDSPARMIASPAGGKGGRRFAAGARKRVRVAVEEDELEAGEWCDVETDEVADFSLSSKMTDRHVLVPKSRAHSASTSTGGVGSSKNYVQVGDGEDDSEEDEEDIENLGVEAQGEERVAGEWIFDFVKGIGKSFGLVSGRD